ncbi:sensor histidine kinase [Kitasatospora azatica]|uniref:sensor histidine kinase n=1 Tax=Kitasatospora azatica TaxID=58347 RepID=UPI00056D73BF|nr:HAMP domain-containing sensor histidine kinase [Kitasatospora azatica]
MRTRAALGAAVAAALAFGLGTVWVGQAVHDAMMRRAQTRASTAVENVWSKIPGSPDEAYLDASYVVVAADGHWLRRSNLFTWSDPLSPPVPLPAATPPTHWEPGHNATEVVVPLPTTLPGGRNGLAGRSVHFYQQLTGQVYTSAQLAQYSGINGLPDQRLTIYVLIDPRDADQATATVTRILGWYVAPCGSVFVAAMAWLVTGLALRPVEAIRRRMARIGEGAFHERVPVPAARDGIARLAETTNTTLGRLEKALGEQRRLVADASHELRSPLAALRSTLEVPLAHPQGVAWPAVVAGALTDTERLQELADDLLLLARTEEDRRCLDSTVELHDLLAEQLAERAHTDPALVFAATLAPATAAGREVLVGRLVRNLLDNAARHADGRIEVALRTADGWAALTIADDGPGIPAPDRERVFERFVRLDTDRNRSTGGAGLGLALVRTIAQALGGTAHAVEPAAGRGAELLVRLPTVSPSASP